MANAALSFHRSYRHSTRDLARQSDELHAVLCVSVRSASPQIVLTRETVRLLADSTDVSTYHYKVQIDFSRSGKPTYNSYIETFSASFRDECLNLNWFESLTEAKREVETWRQDYNGTMPSHGAQGFDAGTVRPAVPPSAYGRWLTKDRH